MPADRTESPAYLDTAVEGNESRSFVCDVKRCWLWIQDTTENPIIRAMGYLHENKIHCATNTPFLALVLTHMQGDLSQRCSRDVSPTTRETWVVTIRPAILPHFPYHRAREIHTYTHTHFHTHTMCQDIRMHSNYAGITLRVQANAYKASPLRPMIQYSATRTHARTHAAQARTSIRTRTSAQTHLVFDSAVTWVTPNLGWHPEI